ncbi:cytochrome b561 and DOMON domain-containing protein At5g47530-like [Cornus florida]|uniref:cytochrome b561 and DOMON domain-containing protein At5g47530-like n=1 Tax=Cornus florida TaxID=4283 RepID=UPI00289D3129|nr:cytochrome b561 and DOMON domain-containing protein At5g47530-like [Cornus florida]
MTSSRGLIILCIIFFLSSVNANTSLYSQECPPANMNKGIRPRQVQSSYTEEMAPKMHTGSLQNTNGEVTMNLRSWKSQHAAHHHPHLRLVHGIINIIAWGMLLPVGVIIARYCRKPPMNCGEWYSLHILCQFSGYFLGSIGWGIGLWLKKSSKHSTLTTHGILGTVLFALATIQVLGIFCFPPREENKGHKYWKIYHHLLGYALIALIIANIFQGINNQSSEDKWRWSYSGILGVLASTALALEICRWKKCINHHAMFFISSAYTHS